MGWYVLYIIVCAINMFLIRYFTNLNLTDAATWLWMILPGIAYGCAGEIYKKE